MRLVLITSDCVVLFVEGRNALTVIIFTLWLPPAGRRDPLTGKMCDKRYYNCSYGTLYALLMGPQLWHAAGTARGVANVQDPLPVLHGALRMCRTRCLYCTGRCECAGPAACTARGVATVQETINRSHQEDIITFGLGSSFLRLTVTLFQCN